MLPTNSEPHYETKAQFFCRFYYDLLRKSSMHGTFHIGQSRTHVIEVTLWYSLMILTGIIGSAMIDVFWQRYYTNPTVVSVERDYMNWNITFPSLTICGSRSLNNTALHEYIKDNEIEDVDEFYNFALQITNATYDNLMTISEYVAVNPDEYVNLIDKLTDKIELRVITAIDKTFELQRVITEMGICYMFNSKISQYFAPEYLDRDELPKEIESYTVTIFDLVKMAFIRNLKPYYEVYIHNPLDAPNFGKILDTKMEQSFKFLVFSATPITTSTDARSLSITQRKCRFIDEPILRHFPIYSKSLCRLECKIQAILHFCDCIPFFYKAKEGEIYCNVVGLQCVANEKENIKKMSSQCDCSHDCENTKFTLHEHSTVNWNLNDSIRWELLNTKIRIRRNVIFGFIDALAGTGNVCTLFLGISVLSIIEGIYYYFIHLPVKCYAYEIQLRGVNK